MGSGCLTCCRWCCCCFLSVVNVLTTILGLTFLAIGGTLLWAYSMVRSVADTHLKQFVFSNDNIKTTMDAESIHQAMQSSAMSGAIVLIVLGIVLVTFSCLGCCGACFGVPACLIIYAVFIGLVLLSQAAIVICWFSNSSWLKDCGRNWLETRVKNYKGSQNADVASMQLDIIQFGFGCCGMTDGNDFYTMTTNWNRTIGYRNDTNNKFTYYNATYPFSCCNGRLNDQNYKCAYANVSEPYSNYKLGCYTMLDNNYDNMVKPVIDLFFYSVAGCLGFEMLLLLGALLIYYHKRQLEEDLPHSGVQYKMQPQMA